MPEPPQRFDPGPGEIEVTLPPDMGWLGFYLYNAAPPWFKADIFSMPSDPRPLPADREAAAVEVLRRIYERDSGYPLYDEDMAREFADRQIAAFIRKFGPLPDPC